MVQVFQRMVPAAAQGEMLELIFFSLLFGYFMTRLSRAQVNSLERFWQGVIQVVMLITDWVMNFAPVGELALVAAVVANTGMDAFVPFLWFFFTVLLALSVHALIVLPLMLWSLGGVNPWRLYRAMAPALLTAFSTSSSSATLPIFRLLGKKCRRL